MLKKAVLVLGIALVFLQSCKEAAKQETKKRPNIVFIMSDDHAYQAISAYSDKLINTPNIDRIAKEGMLFSNATVTNSICAPSRAVILTGKHSHINGKVDNVFPFDTTNVTFPQLMKKAGYNTAMFGKLHFGNNPKGFDEFKILPGQGNYYNPDFITQKGDTTIHGHVTDIITDLTFDWFEKRRDTTKPFLLMYLHKAPHRSWIPAKRHFEEFTKKTFPVPATLFDDYKTRSDAAKTAEMNILKHMSLAYDNKVTDKAMKATNNKSWRLAKPLDRMDSVQRSAWDAVYDPISDSFIEQYPQMNDSTLMLWKFQRYMQDYLGTIAGVDENVGRLLDYLDKEKLSDNTIVIYTSDQGFYLGEHGWYDKRFMYNESFKTPLLIRWPNVIMPGNTEEQMVQNLDYAQTILEIAGIIPPDDMQGESLVPLLKGEKEKWDRDAVYYSYYEYPGFHMVKRHYGIATVDYKLMHFYYDIDEWELYDRKKDPKEINNVFNDPAYAAVVKELKAKLTSLRIKYDDTDESNNKYIQIYKDKGRIKE